jgi:hypothetical protein
MEKQAKVKKPNRRSSLSLERKQKEPLGRGRGKSFKPDLKEWTEACGMFPYDVQIYKYLVVSRETFYKFLDEQRYLEETTGCKSDFLDAYINERKKTKKLISNAYREKVLAGDTGSIIFGQKAFNGIIEQKDIEHIEIKKQQLALKSNEFLSELAKEYNLNKDELKIFADKYFTKIFEPQSHAE